MGAKKSVPVDPKEEAKKNARIISRAIRQIERETKKLEADDKKTLAEIKKLAQQNQHVSILSFIYIFLQGPAKVLSKQLVRSRAQVNQQYAMKS